MFSLKSSSVTNIWNIGATAGLTLTGVAFSIGDYTIDHTVTGGGLTYAFMAWQFITASRTVTLVGNNTFGTVRLFSSTPGVTATLKLPASGTTQLTSATATDFAVSGGATITLASSSSGTKTTLSSNLVPPGISRTADVTYAAQQLLTATATSTASFSVPLPALFVRFSPTTGPFDSPVWVDISRFAMSFEMQRGRQLELNRMEAGTATLVLDNSDRRFDPTNVNGPYYPNLLPMKKFQIGMILSGIVYYIFTGYIESMTLQWENPGWSAVEVQLVDGFDFLSNKNIISKYASGSVANGSVRVGPGLASTFIYYQATFPGAGGNTITVSHVVQGTKTPLSISVTGTVVTVNGATDGEGNSISTGVDAMTAIAANPTASALVTCTPYTGLVPLGGGPPDFNPTSGTLVDDVSVTLSGGTFNQESTGSRIGNVLDAANWPSDQRLIDAGIMTIAAQSFKSSDSEKALSHIQDIESSELGYTFINAQGYMVYHDGRHRESSLRSLTSSATFGDDAALTELEYVDLIPAFDKTYIYNAIAVTPYNSQVSQSASDATSISLYGERDYSLATQLVSASDALYVSQYLLYLYKNPGLRFTSVTVQPIADLTLWTTVLARELGDRVTIHRRPPDYSSETKTVLAQDGYIENIGWKFDENVYSATVTFLLSPPVNTITGQNWLTLDDATYGILDSSNVAGF